MIQVHSKDTLGIKKYFLFGECDFRQILLCLKYNIPDIPEGFYTKTVYTVYT